jgi:thiosulfate/3-mercaptopyruvate sulfurtransferase
MKCRFCSSSNIEEVVNMGTVARTDRLDRQTLRTKEHTMSNGLRHCFLLAIAGFLLMAQDVMAAEGTKGNLVDVTWLQRNLTNPDVVILDASPTPMYVAQHIPGAISSDLMTYGIQEMPAADMEERFQSRGISPGKKIVIYDQGGSMMATRLFFDLYYHGFPVNDLLILDGGLSKWQEAELPVTNDPTPPPKRGTFRITKLRENASVRLPEFLAASGDPENNVLLEALGANWHFGEVRAFDRAGHIPNGIMLPSTDFYNPDKTFKSPDEIQKMLTYLGVRPEQQIHTYCGGGVAASVPFFALKYLLGYPHVKLYKESEMGWLKDERELPYWTYDAPFLKRDTDWLQSWGGKMMRMYGGVHVTVIDVRPAEAFNQGHVPFALNIPADVFKNNITNPNKLAEILGPSGIDVSHEAVVISGAGLTRESALAFLMLERLGQKKVSVFMDSLDTWTQRGFTLTKDATVVGPKKAPQDLSIPPTVYAGNLRRDVIIEDPKSTRGLYPKVFVASGEKVPLMAQDSKVVHVPYTNLLSADGTPKAAKDIWNTLVKAGIPRFAELVCISDDPGDAAVNYFILRLMGYPDVKVLVM